MNNRYYPKRVKPKTMITHFREIFNPIGLKKPGFRNLLLTVIAIATLKTFRIHEIASRLPIDVKTEKSKQKRLLRFLDTHLPMACIQWELIKEGKGNNLVQDRLWHFFRASELQQLAESCGLTTLEMVGCEGLSTGLFEATHTVAEDPTKWGRWVELVLETATEPAIVDMAAHILYIGRAG